MAASEIVLSIETSTQLLGVALSQGKDILFEKMVKKPKVHSAMLLPFIESALEFWGISAQELFGIALSKGPGSFTGLRIGAATAQGLSYGLDKEVALVDGFQVLLEQNLGLPSLACIIGSAPKQTVSAYFVRKGDSYEEVLPRGPRSFVEIRDALDKETGSIYLAGDGASAFFKENSQDFTLLAPHRAFPRPGVLGVIGWGMLQRGQGVKGEMVIPAYHRRSQAEVLLGEFSK